MDMLFEQEDGLTLEATLEVLERAGLIRPDPDENQTFTFRHVLVQDSAYDSLLRQDRRFLHRLTAETLQEENAGRLDQAASLLAYHYDEADEDDKAFEFAMRAGDAAARVFANTEALAHYTHAIQLALQLELCVPEAYHARGKIYERSGNFAAALTDLEEALMMARTYQNPRVEWRCLLDIGVLWSSRDYEFTGIFFQRALARAQEIGDPRMIAQSLNRVGNWYINIERPVEAQELHERALELAQSLNDTALLAETYDFLGMYMIIVGDTRQSAKYYQRAVKLFRETDNQIGLVSSQSAFGFLHRNYDTDLIVVHRTFQDSITDMEQALAWAREMSWRANESFTMAQLAITYASQGSYAHALELAQKALELAEKIQHHQWMVSALYADGVIHADLLDASYARVQFERALELAEQTRSVYWRRLINAWLAVALVAERDLKRANAVIERELASDTDMRTLPQRRLWSARVMYLLGARQPAPALEIIDRLIASAVDVVPGYVMPLLWYLQARALTQLRQFGQAEQVAREGLTRGREENVRPLIWRLYAALSGALRGQGRAEEAEAMRKAAYVCMEQLAAEIPVQVADSAHQERALREIVLERVRARIDSLGEDT
jgi:tetratricopeptide (TPR) repeat protein